MPSIRNLLISLLQKRFLHASTATSSTLSPSTSSSSSSFTVQFLINSCGLPLQSALSAAKKLQLHENNLQRRQSVLEFLKSRDFSDTHIAKLIEKWPAVLETRVKSNLKPKFDFLSENGFVGELLPNLIVANPQIMRKSLDSQIKLSYVLLKSFLHSDEKIVGAMKRAPWLLTTDLKSTVRPNLNFLIEEGVPVDRVAKLLVLHPRAITLKHDKLVYAVNAVKNLGIQPKVSMFIHSLRVMTQISKSTWKKKMEVMKSLGWSEEEIWKAFKHWPYCLTCSEEKLKSAMDFLVNTVNLELQTIIRHPVFLMYGIDKRLRPRYNVFRILQSKNLINSKRRIETLLMISEKDFLEKYVTRYSDKVPGLLQIYGVSSRHRR